MPRTWPTIDDCCRDLIAESGLPWHILAAETGVPKPCLIRYFRGEHGLTVTSAQKILDYYGVELIERKKPRGPKG